MNQSKREKTKLFGAKPLEATVCPGCVYVEVVTVLKMEITLVFRVPTTHDVVTTLLNPNYPKSHLDLLNLGLLGLQIVLYLVLSRKASQVFFFLYFAFWRAAYDAGLGWVLTKQSKKKWIVREVQRLGWLDEERRPGVRNWIRKQLADKMGKDYSFDVRLDYLSNKWVHTEWPHRTCHWNTTLGFYSAKP